MNNFKVLKNFESYDIKEYLKVYKSFIDPSMCDQIDNDSAMWHWSKHRYDTTFDGQVQYPNDLEVSYDEFQHKQFLQDSLWDLIKKYIEDFNYPWFDSWSGYTRVRLNRYPVGTEMRIHFDNITSIFDGEIKGTPLLSIVGSLNDDYTGGDLVFFDDYEVKLSKGDVVIFPSSFMYPHKVTPVTSNYRLSFVSWVY